MTGVMTQMGVTFEADAVVLTTGTFLSGLIHVGLEHYEAGRAGDPPAKTLGARLRELALPVGRLKTGTPPRLDGRTDRFLGSRTATRRRSRAGDELRRHARDASRAGRVLDHAHQRAHARHHSRRPRSLAAFHRRHQRRRPALLSVDRGQGRALRRAQRATRSSSSPRASRRTRSIRTASRRRCRSTCSSSLVHSIAGCERAHILRPGYSIEYDYFDPRALEVDARNQGDPRPLLRRPDQRHDRIRGSRGAGPPRRHQCRALRARRGAAGRRAATRRISACSSTISSRAA